MKKILVISPHTDDAELGCGGAISRWVRSGNLVRILHLSDTSNIFGSSHGSQLRAEACRAGEALGLQRDQIEFANFPTRHFSEVRQQVLDYLIAEGEAWKPDVIIGPDVSDTHQDHQVVANEISRAYKSKSVLRFDTYWNLLHQSPEMVVELAEEDVNRKIIALKNYTSQSLRNYMDEEVIRSQARIRGLPRGFHFAEAFAVSQVTLGLVSK